MIKDQLGSLLNGPVIGYDRTNEEYVLYRFDVKDSTIHYRILLSDKHWNSFCKKLNAMPRQYKKATPRW